MGRDASYERGGEKDASELVALALESDEEEEEEVEGDNQCYWR